MQVIRLVMVGALLIVNGCSATPDQASPSDCFERFYDAKIGDLLDRWVSAEREGDPLRGVGLAFEVVATDRSPKEFEHLLARLGRSDELTVGKNGNEWRLRVTSSSLFRTSTVLSKTLQEACATAAQNNARIVHWEYSLPKVPLDDGFIHAHPVE